jgi:hypothetical protein
MRRAFAQESGIIHAGGNDHNTKPTLAPNT